MNVKFCLLSFHISKYVAVNKKKTRTKKKLKAAEKNSFFEILGNRIAVSIHSFSSFLPLSNHEIALIRLIDQFSEVSTSFLMQNSNCVPSVCFGKLLN